MARTAAVRRCPAQKSSLWFKLRTSIRCLFTWVRFSVHNPAEIKSLVETLPCRAPPEVPEGQQQSAAQEDGQDVAPDEESCKENRGGERILQGDMLYYSQLLEFCIATSFLLFPLDCCSFYHSQDPAGAGSSYPGTEVGVHPSGAGSHGG